MSLEVFCGLAVTCATLTLVHITLDTDDFSERLDSLYSINLLDTLIALLSLLIAVDSCIFLANGHLICFHLWLKCKGLTTHGYFDREKKEVATVSAEQLGAQQPVCRAENAQEQEGLKRPAISLNTFETGGRTPRMLNADAIYNA